MSTAEGAHEVHSAETQASFLQRRTTFQSPESNTEASPHVGSTRAASGASARRGSSHNSRRQTGISVRSLARTLSRNMVPDKPIGQPPGFWQGIKAIIFGSWFNILLLAIPVSWALHFVWGGNATPTQDTLIFVFSFLAIIPLAKLLAFATDELSMRVGQTLAGLLNATLGNAVELIVAIIALVHCELQVVQSSLVGSILSNLLLVLGMCFFAGGTRFSEQGFGVSASQVSSSLLTVSVIAVLLPAAFHFVAGQDIDDPREAHDILALSHGAAIILLFIYGCYLVFQLFSHKSIYDDDGGDIIQSTKYAPRKKKQDDVVKSEKEKAAGSVLSNASGAPLTRTQSPDHIPDSPSTTTAPVHDPEQGPKEDDEEEETPSLTLYMTIGLLVVITVLVAVTAEFLVDSIDGLTNTGKVNKEFIGLILLPIVGNAAEHATAVTVSVKDKLSLSLQVACGSSIQIALFVIPFIVTLGWILGKPLTLLFDPFESIVLFLSVIVVNYVVQDGKSNWLEGMILMCLYIMLALVFWYYPGVSIQLSSNLSC